mgnify:CR=1 FL=1
MWRVDWKESWEKEVLQELSAVFGEEEKVKIVFVYEQEKDEYWDVVYEVHERLNQIFLGHPAFRLCIIREGDVVCDWWFERENEWVRATLYTDEEGIRITILKDYDEEVEEVLEHLKSGEEPPPNVGVYKVEV